MSKDDVFVRLGLNMEDCAPRPAVVRLFFWAGPNSIRALVSKKRASKRPPACGPVAAGPREDRRGAPGARTVRGRKVTEWVSRFCGGSPYLVSHVYHAPTV